jgi:uncharacterized membrane protein YfcA
MALTLVYNLRICSAAHTAAPNTAAYTKQQCNYPYADGDVHWDSRNAVLYPCLCFFAGVFAGLFGIGGGIVKGKLTCLLHCIALQSCSDVPLAVAHTS